MLLEWEDLAKQSDQASRDRLFVLTIAAEKGWSIASDVAFRMKGIKWSMASAFGSSIKSL